MERSKKIKKMSSDKKFMYPFYPFFYRKQKEKSQEIELEIEVQECSHMILNLENLKKLWINLGASDATKIEIGAINLESKEDVICGLTGKPCVLYNPGDETNYLAHINYHHLDRCPSSEDSTKKYKLKGIKREHMFYTVGINCPTSLLGRTTILLKK